jgi:sugar phosphate isomerase/epimerase
MASPCPRALNLLRLGKAGAWLLLACRLLFAGPAPAEPAAPFIVFDALLHAGKPDNRARGLVPISWVGDIWRPGVSMDTVDEAQVRAVFAHKADKSGFYYLDIENWPLLSVSPAIREKSIAKLARVIDLAHNALPLAHIGFYGILPGITYWPLLRHDPAYREWQEVNRELVPLSSSVDAVFPSLYTFYDDPDGWKKYARQTLIEARIYKKPVYVFLWPQFHDSNPELRGKEVPRAFWRAELDLCAELADGVVLWGGWQDTWNENAAWWQETLAFMKARPNVNTAPPTTPP